jgi:hypothetical protein
VPRSHRLQRCREKVAAAGKHMREGSDTVLIARKPVDPSVPDRLP